jgi:hypothetical protein
VTRRGPERQVRETAPGEAWQRPRCVVALLIPACYCYHSSSYNCHKLPRQMTTRYVISMSCHVLLKAQQPICDVVPYGGRAIIMENARSCYHYCPFLVVVVVAAAGAGVFVRRSIIMYTKTISNAFTVHHSCTGTDITGRYGYIQVHTSTYKYIRPPVGIPSA